MKSVLSPRRSRRLAAGLAVALSAMIALPASTGAVPFDPGALLGKLRGLFSSIWGDPARESAPERVSAPVSKPKVCPFDAPGGVCPPVSGEFGCEIEPSGICRH